MAGYPTTDAGMAAYWNEQGQYWADTQARLDARLRPYGEALLKAANPQPGEHGLDIGCGCGDTTLALAKAVAPSGRAVGVDVSAPMIARARARARMIEDGAQIEFLEADAARAPFPKASFDLAISRLGVMFFENPAAAFLHIRSAIRPGGRLVLLCWRQLAENAWMQQLAGAVARFTGAPALADPEAPGPFSFGDPDRVRRILSTAGFHNPAFEKFDWPMQMGDSVEAATEEYSQYGGVGAFIRSLPEPDREAAVGSLRAAMAAHATEDGVRMGSAAWIISARVR